jgi:hypothetical protein
MTDDGLPAIVLGRRRDPHVPEHSGGHAPDASLILLLVRRPDTFARRYETLLFPWLALNVDV